MRHFVTLFDSLFIPQGLTLYLSMERHISRYILWILCIDNKTYEVLNGLNLPNVKLLKLSQLETKELLKVKKERTTGEYCWTLTPFSPKFVFDADNSVNRVTYLDADLWFTRSCNKIFDEFDASKKSVLITEHAYSPEYDQSATSGKYCVQFMTFDRVKGERVRKWWADRCIEWCYNRHECGKFGDQKYLDDWTERFSDEVHVLRNKELILAPWNATRFPYSDAAIWHFHNLRIFKIGKRWNAHAGYYPLPKMTVEYLYKPYVDSLMNAIELLESNGIVVKTQKQYTVFDYIKGLLTGVRRKFGVFCKIRVHS